MHLIWLLVSVGYAAYYDNWKTPEYCGTLDHIQTLTIPNLTNSQLKQNPTLRQVQLLARHGARAPYYNVYCWDKALSPIGETWNCGTSEVMAQDIQAGSYGRLYRKNYDIPRNVLPGTCKIGGLLPYGRLQHLENGRILQKAYIGSGPLKLFRSNKLSDLAVHEVFLRSDDEERTLGSGQALVDGMFDPLLDKNISFGQMPIWHTCDSSKDILFPNAKICPRLSYIEQVSQTSPSYLKYTTSDFAFQTEAKLEEVVGRISWGTILECLMLSRCNDLPLPHNFTEQMFDDAIQQVERREFLQETYSNSWYAKTGTAPLWKTFLHRMQMAVDNDPMAPRLAVVMGHDSTVNAFLAALLGESWDGKWAAYATMVVMELYEVDHGIDERRYSLRFVYKGKVLQIPGCRGHFCDLDSFFELMQFALEPQDCSIPMSPLVHPTPMAISAKESPCYGGLMALGVAASVCIIFLYRATLRNSNGSEASPLLSI